MTFQERVDYLLPRPVEKRTQVDKVGCNWEFSSDADEKKHKRYFH